MTIWATTHEDGITIDAADADVEFSQELLNMADPRYLQRDGNILTISALNGTWTYEIVGTSIERRSVRSKLVSAVRHAA